MGESHAKTLFKNIIWLVPSSPPADAFAQFPPGVKQTGQWASRNGWHWPKIPPTPPWVSDLNPLNSLECGVVNRACLGSLLTCIEIPTVPLTCFETLNKAAPLGASGSLSVNSGDWRWFLSPFQHQHFLNPDQRFPVDVFYLVCKGLSNFTVSCQCLASLISPQSLGFRYLLRLFGRSGHGDAPCPVAETAEQLPLTLPRCCAPLRFAMGQPVSLLSTSSSLCGHLSLQPTI